MLNYSLYNGNVHSHDLGHMEIVDGYVLMVHKNFQEKPSIVTIIHPIDPKTCVKYFLEEHCLGMSYLAKSYIYIYKTLFEMV